MFAEAGLPYAPEIERVPSSRRALALAELARERGVYDTFHERLFVAYWAEGRDIGADDVLVAEAVAAGLDEAAARAELGAPQARLAAIERETARLLELGGGGVPAWAVDGRVLIPGAQPHEVFARVLERLGHEPLG